MNRKWSVRFAVMLLSAAPFSYACAAGTGFYIGGGAGGSNLRDTTTNPNGPGTVDFNANGTGYKGFVGYRFGMIPLIDLAAEGGYTNFGSPSQTLLGQNVQYKLHGVNAAGLLIFPIGPVDLYGKVGVFSWSWDKNIGATSSSKTGTNPFYGAGLGVNVWKIGVRAEYEYYSVSGISTAQMYSLSVLFRF